MESELAENQTDITGEELLAMGDIGPCELVNGKIVKKWYASVRHGAIESNIDYELGMFVRLHKLGRVSEGEVGIYTRRDPDTVRGADIAFISNERLSKRGKSGFVDVAPDLVVEILSPDDRWNEVMQKLEEYLGIGARVVWIVDPETESVFAYRSMTDVRRFEKSDALTADEVLPGFSASVAELFEE